MDFSKHSDDDLESQLKALQAEQTKRHQANAGKNFDIAKKALEASGAHFTDEQKAELRTFIKSKAGRPPKAEGEEAQASARKSTAKK